MHHQPLFVGDQNGFLCSDWVSECALAALTTVCKQDTNTRNWTTNIMHPTSRHEQMFTFQNHKNASIAVGGTNCQHSIWKDLLTTTEATIANNLCTTCRHKVPKRPFDIGFWLTVINTIITLVYWLDMHAKHIWPGLTLASKHISIYGQYNPHPACETEHNNNQTLTGVCLQDIHYLSFTGACSPCINWMCFCMIEQAKGASEHI